MCERFHCLPDALLRQEVSFLQGIQALDVYRAMRHVNEGESEALSAAGRKQVEPLILAVRKRAAQERVQKARKARKNAKSAKAVSARSGR